MTKKNILVTGGAGFIGSNLCERLLNEGHIVTCLDNFYSSNESNIAHLRAKSNFIFVRHDITETISAPILDAIGNVDEVYNLACPASPPNYQKDPVYTLKTCVYGGFNILEFAQKRGIKILQASTSEIYGDPAEHPQTEKYRGNVNPIGIRSCYDEGKRAAECLFFDYQRTRGTKIKVVRIFNTYGPRMDMNDGRVVSNFIVQALRGNDITIYGDGKQTRSFCYVDDMTSALVAMMNDSASDFTGPVNIGNPGEFTMIELAEKVLELVHGKSKISFKPLPLDDPTRRKPDITLATSAFAWVPHISLDEGLKKTILYFKSCL
jgi:UDP-glucuronate decarboxylase